MHSSAGHFSKISAYVVRIGKLRNSHSVVKNMFWVKITDSGNYMIGTAR